MATAVADLGKRHVLEQEGLNTWGIWNHTDWDALTAVIPKLFDYGKQRCTAYPRFVVQRTLFDDFLAAYLPAVRTLRVGHPLAVEHPEDPYPALDFGPVINAAKAKELHDQVAEAIDRGAVPLHRGKLTDARFLPGQDTAAYVQPVTLLNPPPSSPLHHAEPFGPVDTIVLVDTEAELLAAMNASNGALVATLSTDDEATYARLAPQIRAFKVGRGKPRSRGDRDELFGGLGASWRGAFVGGELLVRAVTQGPHGERLPGNFPSTSSFREVGRAVPASGRRLLSRTLADSCDDLVHQPAGDTWWVGLGQTEHDMVHADADEVGDGGAGGGGIVVRDDDLYGTGDLARIPSDVRTVRVQHPTTLGDERDAVVRRPGDVPDVGLLGDEPQQSSPPAADQQRRPGPLHRLGLVPRAPQPVITPLEVEGVVLRPHPAQDRDRFAEPGDPSPGGTRESPYASYSAMAGFSPVIPPASGGWWVPPTPMPMTSRPPEITSTVEAIFPRTAAWADAVAGDEEPEPQPLGLRGQGAEQRPTLMDLAVLGAAERKQMVPEPGVLDLGQGVGLLPDTADVVVGDVHGGGLDTEAHASIAHIAQPR